MLNERIPVLAGDGHHFALEVHETPGADVVVVLLPAMGVTTTYYKPLVTELVAAGLSVASADWRGHGQSDVRARRGVDWGYRELVEVDLPATLEAVRARFPGRRLIAMGHSLGGQVAVLHAAAFPKELSGLVLVASVNVHYRGWGFPAGLAALVATQLVGAISRGMGYFPGDRLRFAGREGRTQMLDWARNARTGRWQISRSGFDFDSLLAKVEIPILAMSIEADRYAPEAALDNQLVKLESADITRHHWTAADLDRAGLNHFRWVRHSSPVVAMVRSWIG